MRKIRLLKEQDDDPLSGVANLFDLGIILALGFMVALLAYLHLPKQPAVAAAPADSARTGQAGAQKLEVVRQDGVKIDRFILSDKELGGNGEKLGMAYRLKTGEVVYIPEAPLPARSRE